MKCSIEWTPCNKRTPVYGHYLVTVEDEDNILVDKVYEAWYTKYGWKMLDGLKIHPTAWAEMPSPYIKSWILGHKGTIAEGFYCPYCGKHGYEWEDKCRLCNKAVKPIKLIKKE